MAVAVRRALCADVSSASAEPLAGTASHVRHWLLVEYRGMWDREVLGKSLLSPPLKAHLKAQLAALPHSRLLFIRRPEERRRERRALFFGTSAVGEERFFRLEFDRHDDLLALDLPGALLGGAERPGVPLDHPLFVVCTHGKRDRCCAKYGRPLYDEMRARVNREWVWQSTHVGGDRFAGNLVCLPEGLYFGRVGPDDVAGVVETYLDGRVALERFRGRSSYPFAVQAAERAVRAETGIDGIDAVRVLDFERRPGRPWVVRLLVEPESQVHEVEVVSETSEEAVYLTCNAAAPRHVRRFVTTSYRVVERP